MQERNVICAVPGPAQRYSTWGRRYLRRRTQAGDRILEAGRAWTLPLGVTPPRRPARTGRKAEAARAADADWDASVEAARLTADARIATAETERDAAIGRARAEASQRVGIAEATGSRP